MKCGGITLYDIKERRAVKEKEKVDIRRYRGSVKNFCKMNN